jgi:membrane-associated phospholipid phosphatase
LSFTLLAALSCAPLRASAQDAQPGGDLAPAKSSGGLAPRKTTAGSPQQLVWHSEWPRYRPIGYGIMALSIAGALTATFLVPYPSSPRWTGGILFDDGARNALRARDPGVRDAIRLASDITLFAGLAQVALVDNLIIPLAKHSPDVAWQLTLMNAQAFSLNILIGTLLFKAAARARPSYTECQANPSFDSMCDTSKFASFPSSHTSTAFTAAGLTCVHHRYLPIYGGAPWDATACIGSLTFATATGLFRLIGDRHYVTDVVMGAAIGLALGYIYPWLLHYRDTGPDTATQASAAPGAMRWGVVPGAAGAPYGVSLLSEF